MQHGERERELMIQLSAALRETERLQEALGDAFEDRRAADRRAGAAESALAAARREVERLRRDLWGYAAELNAASEAGEWERVWDVRDRMKIGARIENALAAPGDGEEGT